ncbi:MAG: IS66 family transposase [Leptospirales bacterium]
MSLLSQESARGTSPKRDSDSARSDGERFLSFLAYANVDQAIPLARVRRFAQDLFGASVSCGSIRSASKKLRGHLSGFLEALRSHLKKAPVIGADESGIRVEGKLMWLHVHSTPSAPLFGVHEKRGKEWSDSLGVLPEFKGTE